MAGWLGSRYLRTGAAAAALAATMLVGFHLFAQSDPSSYPPDELWSRIDAGSAPLLLDVRTRGEFAQGHVPGAINIPIQELAGRLDELDGDRSSEIVVYCERGPRAWNARALLDDAGFATLSELAGHMHRWRDANLPVER